MGAEKQTPSGWLERKRVLALDLRSATSACIQRTRKLQVKPLRDPMISCGTGENAIKIFDVVGSSKVGNTAYTWPFPR